MIADGPPARIVELGSTGTIELVVPDLVRDELLRVLALKMCWEASRLAALSDEVRRVSTEIAPTPLTAEEVTGDPYDDRILACAIEARADVLVTGDRKHLLPVRERSGVRILLPQQLLAELR